MSVEVGGREVAFTGFFTMKADERIPAGAEVGNPDVTCDSFKWGAMKLRIFLHIAYLFCVETGRNAQGCSTIPGMRHQI